MQISTRFSPGDKAWYINHDRALIEFAPKEGTIGKINIEIIDSPGRPGEETFDNHKPQKSSKESYMLVETGIGSGSVYNYPDRIFATQRECWIGIVKEQVKQRIAFGKRCHELKNKLADKRKIIDELLKKELVHHRKEQNHDPDHDGEISYASDKELDKMDRS